MPCFDFVFLRFILILAVVCSLGPSVRRDVRAQSSSSSQPKSDDVIRVNTELVQTDVTVFDRRGKFVDGLTPDQFVLTLSGIKRPVLLLSHVTAGSKSESAQLSFVRSGSITPNATESASSKTTVNSGRLIYFFVDDVHLSAEGIERSRKALLSFVDNKLNPNDQVAVVSSSGQIGFLQQLTDNPTVLHTAINRLSFKQNTETTAGRTRITDSMASQIRDGHNRELFAYLMESVKLEYGMGAGALRGDHKNDSAGQAANLLKNRIDQITFQSRTDTLKTLRTLQSLMESAAGIRGRKLIFFLSDGFVIDSRSSSAADLLRQITQVAARTGAVIYTMDTRGSFLGSGVDASNNDYVDMTSRHAGVSVGETVAPREPLSLMADETGGKAIFNSSSIDNAIRQAVDGTSEYYIVAWRPDAENERKGIAKLDISIAGRPDLRLRLRRSYLASPLPTQPRENAKPIAPEAQLLKALGSSYAHRALPVSLSVGYTKAAGSTFNLQTSMQTDRSALTLDTSETNAGSELDVIGAAIDDRGLIYSFKQVLSVRPQPGQTAVVWNQQLSVKPGLYQVRVAVRERSSGLTGSAMQWIEVPSSVNGRLALSSLFLGERGGEAEVETETGLQSIRVDVDHKFAQKSVLRFQTYVYNAVVGESTPEIWVEARVLRGRERVLTLPGSRVPMGASGDLKRLPYWSEISLLQLPPGNYTLQIEATERTANRTAQQSTNFTVE